MMWPSMPSPKSTMRMIAVPSSAAWPWLLPLLPAVAASSGLSSSNVQVTSTLVLPASIAFCTSSRRKQNGSLN